MKIDLSIITKSINKELTQEADISLTSFRSRLGDFPIVRKAPVTLQESVMRRMQRYSLRVRLILM